MKLLIRIGGRIMAEDKLFSGESKNIEYKVTVPEKSEKYMKTVVAFAKFLDLAVGNRHILAYLTIKIAILSL